MNLFSFFIQAPPAIGVKPATAAHLDKKQSEGRIEDVNFLRQAQDRDKPRPEVVRRPVTRKA